MGLTQINVNNSSVIGIDDVVSISDDLVKSVGIYKLLNKRLKISSDDSNADLNIGDEYGNVIFQVKNGHIKTKNFDSESIDIVKFGNSNILCL